MLTEDDRRILSESCNALVGIASIGVLAATAIFLSTVDWNADILHDILYSRVQSGWGLHNVHGFSLLFPYMAALVLMLKENEVGPSAFALIGMASVKELVGVLTFVAFGQLPTAWGIVSGITTLGLPFGFYLITFAALSLVIVHRWQRNALVASAVLLSVWYFAAMALYSWFGVLPFGPTITPVTAEPSALFRYFWSNVDEVASWVVPSCFFLLPKRLWEWK